MVLFFGKATVFYSFEPLRDIALESLRDTRLEKRLVVQLRAEVFLELDCPPIGVSGAVTFGAKLISIDGMAKGVMPEGLLNEWFCANSK